MPHFLVTPVLSAPVNCSPGCKAELLEGLSKQAQTVDCIGLRQKARISMLRKGFSSVYPYPNFRYTRNFKDDKENNYSLESHSNLDLSKIQIQRIKARQNLGDMDVIFIIVCTLQHPKYCGVPTSFENFIAYQGMKALVLFL